jgi:NTE family protein
MTAAAAFDLHRVPLFADLSPDLLARLRSSMRELRFGEGQVILRAGDPASDIHVIVSGAVRVDLDLGDRAGRRALLGPGKLFGEMSVITGAPVSATVIASVATTTLAVSATELSALLATEPALYKAFAVQLADRLRHLTRGRNFRPAVVPVGLGPGDADAARFVQALVRGIQYYCPGSKGLDPGTDEQRVASAITQWKAEGAGDQYLVVPLPVSSLEKLDGITDAGDLTLIVSRETPLAAPYPALASAQAVVIGKRPRHAPGPWPHVLSIDELAACLSDGNDWDRRRYPKLDRLVRYVTFREVGLALSIGAASGLAHFGFLEALYEADIPVDFVCGSSMGGVIALAHAHYGSVKAAAAAVCDLASSFQREKGIELLPRAGLVPLHRTKQIVDHLFARTTFADLEHPAAVVAADLVAGERVILDRGSVAHAALATSAIPGLFTPVRSGERILVDGGLVTQLPADVLHSRRCGVRIAALVRPDRPHTAAEYEKQAAQLQGQLERVFGFRSALAASWRLLGWWDSSAQAQRADVVVNIYTPSAEHFNFGAGSRMIECGRRATAARIDNIRAVVERGLAPGMP